MADRDSYMIVNGKRVCAYIGPDATKLVRAISVMVALRLYARTGIILTRNVTITKLLQMAGEYTRKTYKRSETSKAAEDVQVWVDTMRAALPVVKDNLNVARLVFLKTIPDRNVIRHFTTRMAYDVWCYEQQARVREEIKPKPKVDYGVVVEEGGYKVPTLTTQALVKQRSAAKLKAKENGNG